MNHLVKTMDNMSDERTSEKTNQMIVSERSDGRATKNIYAQLKTNDRYYVNLGVLVLLVAFGLLGVWAATAPLNSSVVAPGVVVSEIATKEVEHLSGGIVEKILVKDGDLVKKGELLLKLDDTQERTQYEVLESQYFDTIAIIARLEALLENKQQLHFPKQLLEMQNIAQRGSILNNQQKLFDSIQKSHAKKLEIIEQTKKQIQSQITGLKRRLSAQYTRSKSYANEIKEREQLVIQKLDNNLRLRELQREKYKLDEEIADAKAKQFELGVKLKELEDQRVLENNMHLKELLSELENNRAKKSELDSSMLALIDKIEKAQIFSPEDGAIVGLSIDTIGGIVRGGEVICEIVPQIKAFAIKSRINPMDIDKVVPGQQVEIRFSSFDTRFTQVIEGKLARVSADTIESVDQKDSFYEARILVNEAGFKTIEKKQFEIIPGMPVESMIKVGERTLLEYLIKPFSDMLANAFNED